MIRTATPIVVISFFLSILLTLNYQQAQAQALTVSNVGNNGNASYLVQNVLVGGCLTVSNITYTGNAAAIGYFSNATPMGVSDGIILSTGSIYNAPGPNSSPSQSTSFFGGGDADLNSLPGGTTQDAAVLRFSFLPLSSDVSFDFVFASEEYPEFVDTGFNDVFGFFISGPGITGQQNIALVPGTSTPITINTINAVTNSSYYTPNLGTVTQFDGYTKVLTATATGLTPCQLYTIKLAIGDVGDSAYDSAVFLQANSFNAGQSVSVQGIVPSSQTGEAYEGCQDGYFLFTRPSDADLSVPLTIPINVSGTAQPNVDYAALPTEAVIAAGDTSVLLNINAYSDALAEGSESIIVAINQLLCNCTLPPPDTISIFDSPEPFEAFISNDPVICPGDDVTIAVVAAGSQFTPYNYVWNNGSNFPYTIIAPTTTTSYTITVTDGCGRQINQTVTVNVSAAAPNADITDVPPLCSVDGTISLQSVSDGGTWSGAGVDPQTGVFDPVAAVASGASSPYTITYSLNNTCGSDSDNTVIVVNTPGNPIINPVPLQCANGNPITLTANVSGGTWSGAGIVGGSNTTGQFNPALVGSSSTTISYTVAGNCGGVGTLVINVNTIPTASISGGGTVCGAGGSPAPISITSTGSLPFSVVYAIDGVNQPPLNIATNPYLFPATQAGVYTLVSASNSNGCPATLSGSATVLSSNISASVNATNAACFNGLGSAAAVVINGATPYSYQWNVVGVGNTANPPALAAGSYAVTATDANGCTASASATIGQPTQLMASLVQASNTCTASASGAIQTQANGGTPNYSYQWSGGAGNAANATNLAASTYTLTVTDANACTATLSHTITANPLPAPSISGDALLCTNQVGELCLNSSFNTYNWSVNANGQTSQCINVTNTATYTVTVSDANNCSASATFAVEAVDIQLSAFATNADCGNVDNGTVSLTILGGEAPYNFEWNVASIGNQQNPTNLAANDYAVTITDQNGCTAAAAATVTQPEPLQLNVTPINPDCNNPNGEFSVSVLGGVAPYGFAWSGGLSNTQNPTNVPPATYTLSITDANNCTETATATIDAASTMSLNINATNAICNGQANGSISLGVNGGTPPYNYNWSGTLPDNTPNQTNNVAAGTYTVTVTDAVACTATASAVVGQNAALQVTTNAANLLCNGQTNASINTTVSGGGGTYAYAWSGGLPSVANQTNNLAVGTYTLTVTDQSNCSATAVQTITQPTALQINLNAANNVSCFGLNNASIDVSPAGGTAPYSYNWSGTLPDVQDATNLSAATYSLTVTDGNGCTASSAYNISQPTAMQVSASTANASCGVANGEATISVQNGTPPYQYAWNVGGLNGSTYNNLAAAAYTVTVTDLNACTATTALVISNSNAPTIVLNSIAAATCGNANGSIDVTVSGGTGTVNLLWSNGATTDNIGNLAANDYNLVATDAVGCQAVANYMVAGDTPLSISLNDVVAATCGNANGSFSATAIGGTAPYNWSTGETNNSIANTNLLPTTYSLTVTDANGCTAFAEQIITNNNSPNISNININNATCGACNGSISAVVAGGVGALTVTWSNGQTGNNLTNLCAGTYTLTVTDTNGCTATDSAVVSDFAGATASLDIDQNPTCAACNGVVTANATGGLSPFAYAWSHTTNPNANQSSLCVGAYTVTITDANGCTATATANLSDAGLPLLSAATTAPETCNSANGSISLSASGGTGALQYAWAGSSSSTALADNLAAGTYTLTVTDQNNCTATQSFVVTQPALPAISGGSVTNANCGQQNGAAQIVATGAALTYQWTGSSTTTNAANGLATGSYGVTVTDQYGCTADTSLSIGLTDGAALALLSLNDASCGLPNGSISVTANGGTLPYTYAWQEIPLLNTPTANNLAAGSYTVVVTDAANCSVQQTFEVVALPTEQVALIASGVSCTQATTIATDPAATWQQYEWSTGETSSEISVNAPTQTTCYTVTVTDQNACTSSASVCIDAPILPNLIVDNIIAAACSQATGSAAVIASQGAGGYAYQWSSNNSTDNTASNLTAGVYTVTVTDTDGCSATLQLNVPQSNGPNIDSANTTAANCGASVGTAQVTASGGADPLSYAWSGGISTTAQAANLSGGTYTVTITDATGCSISASLTVAANTAPQLSLTASTTNCGLNEGSITASANNGTPNYVYQWNDANSQTSAVANNLAAGTYTVTLTDANNCTATAQAIVTATIGNPTVSCGNGTETTLEWVIGAVQGAVGYAISLNGQTDTIPATQLNYVLTGLAPNSTQTITVVALGGSCGNSSTVSQSCTTANCPSNPIVWSLASEQMCINEAAVPLVATPAGGTFAGSGVQGSVFDPAIAGAGSHLLSYDYTDASNGCSYTQTQTIVVAGLPLANFEVPTALCLGNEMMLNAPAQAGVDYTWTWTNASGVQGSASEASVSWIADEVGEQSITLTTTNDAMCSADTTLTLWVSEVNLVAYGDTLVRQGSSVNIGATATSALLGDIVYSWTGATVSDLSCTNCAQPSATPSQASNFYTVLATDQYGCAASALVTVSTYYSNELLIPSAFSPNADDNNDVFRISGSNIAEFDLHIFDRWGQKVYEIQDTDINKGWDGKRGNVDAEIGVYVFYVNVRFNDQKTELVKGNLTLLR